MLKNGTPASPATAREQGLAGSRRPHQQHAPGNTRPKRSELLRVLQELNDFGQLFLGFLDPGNVWKVTVGRFAVKRRARLLKDIAWLLEPWDWRIMKMKMPTRKSVGRMKDSILSHAPSRRAETRSCRR